jgi:hypothetical protein
MILEESPSERDLFSRRGLEDMAVSLHLEQPSIKGFTLFTGVGGGPFRFQGADLNGCLGWYWDLGWTCSYLIQSILESLDHD